MLWLPTAEIDRNRFFSRTRHNRLKKICVSRCVNLKFDTLNRPSINGDEGYGKLDPAREVGCTPVNNPCHDFVFRYAEKNLSNLTFDDVISCEVVAKHVQHQPIYLAASLVPVNTGGPTSPILDGIAIGVHYSTAKRKMGYGKLRLPNMEVNGKGLFSREIYDRLKIICLSSCVDLKVNFLNSLTINGGATGYGITTP